MAGWGCVAYWACVWWTGPESWLALLIGVVWLGLCVVSGPGCGWWRLAVAGWAGLWLGQCCWGWAVVGGGWLWLAGLGCGWLGRCSCPGQAWNGPAGQAQSCVQMAQNMPRTSRTSPGQGQSRPREAQSRPRTNPGQAQNTQDTAAAERLAGAVAGWLLGAAWLIGSPGQARARPRTVQDTP